MNSLVAMGQQGMASLASHIPLAFLEIFAAPEDGGSTTGWVIGRILLMLLIVHIMLIMAALMVWAERRVSAWMQDRLGPNRVGPQGLLQPLADLGKFMFKEDVVPNHVHKFLYSIAPTISVLPALVTFAVIPFGGSVTDGTFHSWQIADLNIGVLFILSMAGISVYGITIGGWASNSKYSLLGGVRASAQMISYELSMGLSIVPVVLIVGSLSLGDIVAWQGEHTWFLFTQPLAAFIFLVAVYAETNRLPFDMPESETELVAGYHTEYSSMKFALFFMAEYCHMIVGSALMTTLFLGGWTFFGLEKISPVLGVLIFCMKAFFLLFVFIWVRWTLPRFRYDQLMRIGWVWLIPLTLINILMTAGAEALDATWVQYVVPVAVLVVALIIAWLGWRKEVSEPLPLASDPNARDIVMRRKMGGYGTSTASPEVRS